MKEIRHFADCRSLETDDPRECNCRELDEDAYDAEMEAQVDRLRDRE